MSENVLLMVDSYKVGHIFQYPEGTTEIFSNFTARTDKHSGLTSFYPQGECQGVLVVGVQAVLKEYFLDGWGKFFTAKGLEWIQEFQMEVSELLGYKFPVDAFFKLHELGYLPLEIRSLPEGTLCPIGVPFLTIRNTHPEFAWLTNFVETALSAELWPIITAGTKAFYFRCLLEQFAKSTGMPDWFVAYQGHDFSLRGASGIAAGAKTGLGHSFVFQGTDNFPALQLMRKTYDNPERLQLGASVNATEHSVMCIGGRDGEDAVIERLIDLNPTGTLSMVLDGFDFFKAIDETLPKLKAKILARDGKLVVRPDSGDPEEILCGSVPAIAKFAVESCFVARDVAHFNALGGDVIRAVKYKYWDKKEGKIHYVFLDAVVDTVLHFKPTLEEMGAFEILEEHFGSSVNEKGLRVLNEKVGLIYGDSITFSRALDILGTLEVLGFASQPVLGLGSYFYQYHTRDTFGMAIKATHAIIKGVNTPMQKDPATGDGTKKSLTGYIGVYQDKSGALIAKDNQDDYVYFDRMYLKFANSVLCNGASVNKVRNTVKSEMDKVLGLSGFLV